MSSCIHVREIWSQVTMLGRDTWRFGAPCFCLHLAQNMRGNLALEIPMVASCGGLVENARFGNLDHHPCGSLAENVCFRTRNLFVEVPLKCLF